MTRDLDLNQVIVLIAAAALAMQFLLSVVTIVALRTFSREQSRLHTELFGLLRKLEGLTASRREQVLRHYNKLLETMSARLPTTVAAQAGQVIFEAESRLLARLAELEPNLHSDADSKRKLDELIVSMEKLEQTLVNLTADTVHKVMVEGRRSLIADESFDEPLAA